MEDAPDGVLDLNKAAEALNVRCAALKLYNQKPYTRLLIPRSFTLPSSSRLCH